MENPAQFQKYFDEDILDITDLNHEGNNQLLRISTNSGEFMLKKYNSFHAMNWQRGAIEFKALSYLWGKGFREIPQPFNFYEEENIGIYSYERGRNLDPSEVKEEDIIQTTNFLVKLHNLGNEDKRYFLPAPLTCFSFQEHTNALDQRANTIFDYEIRDPTSKKAKFFFDKEVIPRMDKLKRDLYRKTKSKGFGKKLSLDEQVLTHGDWGFHNVLVDGGNYKFIDFEYFGRDDPAGQILHFLNHDKSSSISNDLKTKFLDLYIEKRNLLNTKESFKERLELLNPFIKMSWVLIILNVFCKSRMEYLDFTDSGSIQKLEYRLSKAQKRFKEI